MSNNKPFVIRDPVHGYLAVATHERVVVDHPVTQRLRRIAQTGLAEMVFPEANTSRFVHSLGAMHLASRFIVACIENASSEVRDAFFLDIDAGRGDWFRLEELDPLLKHEGTLTALMAGRAILDGSDISRLKQRRLLVLVESGLRLAALFHDLGHLPFSHDAEYALQEYVQKLPREQRNSTLLQIAVSPAPHEEIGHRLAKLVINDLISNEEVATRAAFSMGLQILNMEPPDYGVREKPNANAFAWLHSLVDGEIDVDRADYILRDGQALGLDFASYDLDRLAANLVLERHPDLGYVTAVREAGLAALESYCIARSRSTEVFIHHHKVAQTAAALRYSSIAAYGTARGKLLIDFLGRLESSSDTGKELLSEFADFDDGWWIETLRELRRSTPAGTLLHSCLCLVLDRSRSMNSVWKRLGDLTPEQAFEINQAADEMFGTSKGSRMVEVVNLLQRSSILIHRFGFKPFVRRPVNPPVTESASEPIESSNSNAQSTGVSVMLVRTRERGLQPASIVSARIAALQAAWDGEVHLFAFTSREDLSTVRAEVLLAVQHPAIPIREDNHV